MKLEEFYREYANLPTKDRGKIVFGDLSMNDVYEILDRLENYIRPYKINQTKLLRIVEKFLYDRRRS